MYLSQNFDRGLRNSEGRSLLTGPIPPSPGYEFNPRPSSAPVSPNRIARVHGSDAKLNYKRATQGTGVPFLFEVQGSSVFPSSGLASKPPRNHMNENAKRIRRIMRETRQRQLVKQQREPTPVKELWKSTQYDHVQSKVKQKLEEDTQRSLSRPQSAQGQFLRAHGNTGPDYIRSQSARSSRRNSIDSTVSQGQPAMKQSNQPDFVKLNANYVKDLPKTRKSTSEEMTEQARQKKEQKLQAYCDKQSGRVPDYIEKMKDRQAQEAHEQRMNAPDPECPPGHVKVDNDQRLNTLRQLQLNRAELEKKLSHLPIRNDSVTIRRTKEEIEKKIIELDEAIKIFSKPKVFVRMEE